MKKRSKLLALIILLFVAERVVADEIDSLMEILHLQLEKNDERGLLETYHQLGVLLVDHEAYEQALENHNKALKLAKRLNRPIQIAESLFGIGLCHEKMNNFQEALQYYFRLIEMDEKETGNAKKAEGYSQLSSINQALGDYEKAFELQMQALRLHELHQDSVGIARAHYVLGTIFYYQERYDQALDHYQTSKQICDALKIERIIYSCLSALGSVYSKLGNDEKSFFYSKEALELAQKLNYKTGIAYSLGNIASDYLQQQQFTLAEQSIKRSNKLKEELGDTWGVIGGNLRLAQVYLKSGKAEKAIPLLETGLQMAIEIDAKPRQLEAYQFFTAVYSELNEIDKAFLYQNKYIALKDSLLSEKTVEEMGQSKRRYEIQKKEHEIELLKKENELLGKNKKIQTLQIYIFAIAGLLLLMFSLWFLNRLKFQRNINNLLEEKNQILNVKNEEINIKNKQLEHSNEDLQQFAYVASHDLKEPLRMISSYTTLLQKRYNSMLDEPGKEFMHYIVDAVDRMKVLLDDLLDYSRAGNQQSPATWVAVEDVMLMVEANLRHRFDELGGTLVVRKENLPAIKAHRTQILQLLQNLVSNAAKFKGDKDPVVVVDCAKKSNQYIFSVKDNGIGISPENQQKVFEMFRRLHTREEYEGTGIGLATCKRIVSNLGGDIWVESKEGEGSTFFFSVPCPVEEPALA